MVFVWTRRREIAVLLLVSSLLAPALCIGALTVLAVALSAIATPQHVARPAEIRGVAAALALSLGALAGLVATRIAVLSGATVRRSAALRRALEGCIAAGVCAACTWLLWVYATNGGGEAHRPVRLYWSVPLVPPIAVGVRQFVVLAGNDVRARRLDPRLRRHVRRAAVRGADPAGTDTVGRRPCGARTRLSTAC